MTQSLPRSLAVLLLVMLSAACAHAQWQEYYATWDERTNGTGHNTPSVGVIGDNMFVAMVMTPGLRNFLVPYVNADSSLGRVNYFGYGSGELTGLYQLWTDGSFDQVQMTDAWVVRATADSTVYVANNDPDHNILVFRFTGDTMITDPRILRQSTGLRGIFGLSVAASGHVVVCSDTSNGVTDDIQVFKPLSQWGPDHIDPPLSVINLPDGVYKGIVTDQTCSQIWVADYNNRRVLKYQGTPGGTYTLDTGFNFQLTAADTIPLATTRPGIVGMGYLPSNNILFATSALFLGGSTGYAWSRIHLLNPNTGEPVSSDTSVSLIDVANWNLSVTGSYNDRGDGTQWGNASGYASTYDVQFDSFGNLYSQSRYGWTIEKWHYNGTLPVITGVEEVSSAIPDAFTLAQNYPNPFNPLTNIEFRITQGGSVSLRVYDLLGKEIATLVDEQKAPGTYRATFDARNLPSGTYFYTLRSGASSQTRRMLLLK